MQACLRPFKMMMMNDDDELKTQSADEKKVIHSKF